MSKEKKESLIGKKVLAKMTYHNPEAIVIAETNESVKIQFNAQCMNTKFENIEVWIPKSNIEVIL